MSPAEFWVIVDEHEQRAKGPEKVGTLEKSTFDRLVKVLESDGREKAR